MSEIDVLRQEILSFVVASDPFEGRLEAYEDAVRRLERQETLAAIHKSLNTLRSLVAFLRQEVLECLGPLEKICAELEGEVSSSLIHTRTPDAGR